MPPESATGRDSIPTMIEDLELWSEFNVAMVGATAALAGLVIVASSVNIAEIVKTRSLTARLAAGIAALVLAIVASGLGLIPGISAVWFGTLLIVAAAGRACSRCRRRGPSSPITTRLLRRSS
jgi:hypothetical protein